MSEPPAFEPGVRRAVLGSGLRGVEQLLAAGIADPTASLDELLPRANRLVGARVGRSWPAWHDAVLPILTRRWAGRRLDEWTLTALNGWYADLRHPPAGSAAEPVSRTDLMRITDIVLMVLAADRVGAILGEPVEVAATNLVAAWSAGSGGVGAAGGDAVTATGIALGTQLGRRGTRHGGSDTIARTLPGLGTHSACGLWVTEHHVGLVTHDDPTAVRWRTDRAAISGVHRSPRLQLLARCSVRFTDSSRATFMTSTVHAVRLLQETFGEA